MKLQSKGACAVDFIQPYTGGLNHLPYYLLSISVSMAVIKDFSKNYMKALGLNQEYILLKLCNNYYIVLICSFVLDVRYGPQSPSFPQKLATALKNKSHTLHSTIHVYHRCFSINTVIT